MVKKIETAIDYKTIRLDSVLQGERNDCSVVAVSLACDTPYRQVHNLLAGLGRRKRSGTHRHHTMEAIDRLGFKLRQWTMTEVERMIASYPSPHRNNCKYITSHHLQRFPKAWEKAQGTLLLFSSRHVLCARGGEVLDWSVNNALRIVAIYEVTKK